MQARCKCFAARAVARRSSGWSPWGRDMEGSSNGPRPALLLNPTDDGGFTAYAPRLVDDGARTRAELEHRRRDRHPFAGVRRRELAGEQSETWYVYRDGRWVASTD